MKRREIRIYDPEEKLLETVERLAKEEKRTIGKQAEYMISQYIKLTQKKQK